MTEYLSEDTIKQLLRIIPASIRNVLRNALINSDGVQEIVLRCNHPVCIYTQNGMMFITKNGCLTYDKGSQPLLVTDGVEVSECFNAACGYSVYSHMNEIKEGFVTINGGHRVGISGTAVISSGEIVNIREVSTISLRICREITGCGKDVANLINSSSSGVLICGIPSSGKTTVLRDVARILSIEERKRVTLIDTRGELASSYRGVPQMNVGLCDVMNGYPRAEGIIQAVKVFSPEFIVCDEIGSKSDSSAILSGINSGVSFVTTAHAADFNELLLRPFLKDILFTGAFENIVFLSGRSNPGVVKEIVNVREKMYD